MTGFQIQPIDFTPAQWIQVMHPEEPDWAQVDNKTLILLVKDFVGEQSCATTAIFHLANRHHSRAKELAKWLLAQENSDQWLNNAALDVLATDQPRKILDLTHHSIDGINQPRKA